MCVYLIFTKKKKKSRHKLPNLHTECLLFFLCRSIPRDWQQFSKLERYKGVDGKDNSPMGPNTIQRERRKWAEETAIVPLLTFLSNYARVKAQVTRKIILVVNHLPCFVYIKEALVLTTFRSHSFPPTFKTHQVARLAKIWIKWLYYGEHLFANQETGFWFRWLYDISGFKTKYAWYHCRYFR